MKVRENLILRLAVVFYSLLLATVFGCSSGTGIDVKKDIGSDGGTITASDGLTVTIPAGAIDGGPITIEIKSTTAPVGDFSVLSTTYQFLPSGIQFNIPVEVTIPFKFSTGELKLFWSQLLNENVFDIISGTILDDNKYQASITHFSTGFIGLVTNPSDGGFEDAAVDGGIGDAGYDAGVDAGQDAGLDAGADAGTDAGMIGVWKDPTTDYYWQITPPADKMTRTAAGQYCSDLTLGGRDNWYMPNLPMLRTLVRDCPASQTGGACVFNNDEYCSKNDKCNGCGAKEGCYWDENLEGTCADYWSGACTSAIYGTFYYYINFATAAMDGVKGTTTTRYVRCISVD